MKSVANLGIKRSTFLKLLIILLISSINKCSYETVISSSKSGKCDSSSKSNDCHKASVRSKSRVEASVSVVSHNSTILNLVTPLNKCVENECKYCCLSINRCGTKTQCKNSKHTLWILKVMFIVLIIFCLVILAFKIYMNHPLPEQMTNERVDGKIITELLELYGIIRMNRKNIIVA